MIRDVLVANPQSAKSNEVIEQLNERLDPMPAYMMGQIMNGKNTTSAKEDLEARLSNSKAEKSKKQ